MKKQKRTIAWIMAFLMLAGSITVNPLKADAEEQQNASETETGSIAEDSQGNEDLQEDVTTDEGQQDQLDENSEAEEEQSQTEDNADDAGEPEELKANSWRYRDGEPINQDSGAVAYSSRAASNAWK